jgi:putative ABC transport system permease protein
MLLVGAGLMGRSFLKLRDVPLGFDPSRVMTIKIDLPGQRFRTAEQQEAFFDAAGATARQVRGVEAVAFGLPIPLSGQVLTRRYVETPGERERVASAIVAYPGYAQFLGVPLHAGRYLELADRARDVPPVMIDERMAALVWPDRSAVGRRLLLSPGLRSQTWTEVVGVVGHIQLGTLGRDQSPQVWVSYRAMPYGVDLAFRTRGDGQQVAAAVKRAVEGLGPGRPLFAVRALDEYVADASAESRFATFVLGVFALLAVTLAAIGVYGVVAYATARRTREIAVRVAMGAGRRSIVTLVVREGSAWIAAGIVAGVGGALALSRYLGALLFDVPRQDPLTFAITLVLLVVVALAATAIPALRAARVDPMIALRSE